MNKLLLLLLVVFMAFAVASCGEKSNTAVQETEKDTEVADASDMQVTDAGDMQVTKCDGNVCRHEAGSSRECAVEGKCPQLEQAEVAKAGVACPYAAECIKAGKCTGKCGGACKGECQCEYCKGEAKHVCTEACGATCPYAKAASTEGTEVKKATEADACKGCPRANACKTGS